MKLYLVDRHGGCLSTTSLVLEGSFDVLFMSANIIPVLLSPCVLMFSQLTLAYLVGVAGLIFFFST